MQSVHTARVNAGSRGKRACGGLSVRTSRTQLTVSDWEPYTKLTRFIHGTGRTRDEFVFNGRKMAGY